jgi:hypothetical protein
VTLSQGAGERQKPRHAHPGTGVQICSAGLVSKALQNRLGPSPFRLADTVAPCSCRKDDNDPHNIGAESQDRRLRSTTVCKYVNQRRAAVY